MPTTVRKRVIRIGPDDNGRAMSLADFDRAIAAPGYLYELGEGAVEVSEIPNLEHGRVVEFLRDLVAIYKHENPGIIDYSSGGSDSKVLIELNESERHPDLSIYCKAPPQLKQPWDLWVPEIVVEVVSESSRKRDYDVKPAEYLAFGVKEYWIIDPVKKILVVNIRVGGRFDVKVLKASQKHQTHILPGLKIDVRKLLRAATGAK
ncbi:MAG: Uma2 family endonuclease [Burkholderiales bacterium]|nr:Uma2 family endonuclease [Phycisphaerae bacterium]